MARRSLTGLPDHVLLRDLAALVARDRSTSSELLQHLAEVDERQLHLPAGYPSLYQYCVAELRMSEDVAYKRIRAARAARDFPAILDRIEDGRLHLTAVVTLASHLTRENAAELLEAGSRKTKSELEQLLAERFPQADVPTVLQVIPVPRTAECAAVGSTPVQMGVPSIEAVSSQSHELVPEPVVTTHAPAPARVSVPPRMTPSRVTPLAPERYALQVTLAKATHDKLRRAQELLAHAVPSGDIAEVLDRALDALIEQVEKKRFAAASRPGVKRASKNTRHIPADVRRAVQERDGGQCTFVSTSGKRCDARRLLDYDHVHPVARGGQATVANTRLLCRAHNQHAAERTYGAGFMREKRQAAKARAETASMLRGLEAERKRMRDGARNPVAPG